VALAVQPHVVAKDGARYLKLCSPVVADTTASNIATMER